MTAIENRRRRQQNRKVHSAFRRLVTKRKMHQSDNNMIAAATRVPSNSELLRLDSLTASLIKMQITMLIHSSKRGAACTVLTMANALLGNFRARELYARQSASPGDSDNADDVPAYLRRSLFGFSFPRRKQSKETRLLKRRYAYTNALQHLETHPGAASRTIANYDDAKAELEKVFTFPEEAADSIENEQTESTSPSDPVMIDFLQRLNTITLREETESVGLRPSQRIWQEVANASLSPKIISDIVDNLDKTDQAAAKRLQEAYKERDERQRNSAVEQVEEQIREREAAERASSLMRPLTEDEQEVVQDVVHGYGNGDETVAQEGTDKVLRRSMQTLKPRCWLNDEVIHYFYLMLAKRDEEMCRNDPKRKRSHFFKSFFMTKLLNEGHVTKEGEYEYSNVKRWTKKVPGKDVFKLDKILFPINQGNMHWTCAAVFMQKKKIAFYDSMGSSGMRYLKVLMRWIKDEHQAKKGCPLPDEDEWQLVPCDSQRTPQQLNGFDCGVFTCMFADFISKDCPLVFDQSHITQCRERIAVSIMNGKAIM